MKKTGTINMKKLLFIGLTMTLGINGYASECKLLLKPSDFQLDKNFAVQNESNVFSKIANQYVQSYMYGYTKGRFCGGIQSNLNETVFMACVNEFSTLSEKYTLKHDIESYKITRDVAEQAYYQTKAYRLKTSKYKPISEEHLCYLQKKYGDKTITEKDTAFVKQKIEEEQKKAYNYYSAIADKIGMSENAMEIMTEFNRN